MFCELDAKFSLNFQLLRTALIVVDMFQSNISYAILLHIIEKYKGQGRDRAKNGHSLVVYILFLDLQSFLMLSTNKS